MARIPKIYTAYNPSPIGARLRANQIAFKGYKAPKAGIFGGTLGRTGKTAGQVSRSVTRARNGIMAGKAKFNLATGKWSRGATSAAGRAGRVAGKAKYIGRAAGTYAKTSGGRLVLSTVGQAAVIGSITHHSKKKLIKAGYTKPQIQAARKRTQGRGVGRGSMVAGTIMSHLGASSIGRGGRKGNLLSAGLIAGGTALNIHGARKYNRAVERSLTGGKGLPAKSKAPKGRGMSRSAAARVAALARWHGGGKGKGK